MKYLNRFAATLALAFPCAAFSQNKPVAVTQQHDSYLLQNAYVNAEVDRFTGDLKSLKYQGQETMGYTSGHWEQNPSAAAERTDGISIDPATNNAINGLDTTWAISFATDAALKGTAVLRAGICGVAARHVFVAVNGTPVGDLAPLVYNATINRDGIQGSWSEHDVPFPANLLQPSGNELTLRISGGNVLSGVIYDYLRLELDETGTSASAPHRVAP